MTTRKATNAKKPKKTMQEKLDKLDADVTASMLDLLKQGVKPWENPYVQTGFPWNVASKCPYQGMV